jgi:integrase
MQEVRGSNPLSSTRSEACWTPVMIIGEQNGEQAASYPRFMGSQASGARRRGRNEGSIYKDKSKGRWYAAVSVGFAPDGKTWLRDKVSGATRAEVAEKLENLQAEYDAGVQPDHAYTVQRAVDDWLAEGLDGRSDGTVTLNRHVLKPVTALIGGVELRALTAQDVRRALVRLAAGSSTRTVTIAHNALTRVIRHAEANRYVVHNVAALVDTPKGQPGRPSKALTADHAAAVLKASQESRLGAYVVVCLMTGIRTEEARALRWDHVNMDAASIAVWRSVRLGSDTKTTKSRRTLGMPQAVVESLREHRVRQDEEKLAAAELWLDHDLVFTTAVGTALDAANVRRSFRGICKAAGIGQAWTPRELRTSFVSLLSASGVPVDEIARLAGHSSSRTTETIYRKELRPVLVKGAEVMDQIFPA